MKKRSFLFLLRGLPAVLYIISGAEKLLSPQENFIYVIQGYDFLRNIYLERLTAGVFPWLEFIFGVFLLLGLWTRFSIGVLWCLTTGFIVVVGQAIVRHLPVTECGCFGDLISIPLPAIVMMDTFLFLVFAILFVRIDQTTRLSLDGFFRREK